MATSAIFEGIGPDDVEKLKRALKLKVSVMKDGDVLVDEGEQTDVFWLLIAGRLQGARCYHDGGVDLVQMYAPGDTVCLDVVFTRTRKSLLQISCVRFAEVIAVDRRRIFRSSLRAAVKDAVTANILRMLADDSMRKQYKIDVLYKKSLRSRIRIFLLHMTEKTDSPSFDIGMDREQLARFLGVNRSALSHELSLMRRDGLIVFTKSRFELLPDFYTVPSNEETPEDPAEQQGDPERDTERDSEKDPERGLERAPERAPESDPGGDPEGGPERDPESDPGRDSEKDPESVSAWD